MVTVVAHLVPTGPLEAVAVVVAEVEVVTSPIIQTPEMKYSAPVAAVVVLGFLVKEAVELLDFGSLMALRVQVVEEVLAELLEGKPLEIRKTQEQVAHMAEVPVEAGYSTDLLELPPAALSALSVSSGVLAVAIRRTPQTSN